VLGQSQRETVAGGEALYSRDCGRFKRATESGFQLKKKGGVVNKRKRESNGWRERNIRENIDKSGSRLRTWHWEKA